MDVPPLLRLIFADRVTSLHDAILSIGSGVPGLAQALEALQGPVAELLRSTLCAVHATAPPLRPGASLRQSSTQAEASREQGHWT